MSKFRRIENVINVFLLSLSDIRYFTQNGCSWFHTTLVSSRCCRRLCRSTGLKSKSIWQAFESSQVCCLQQLGRSFGRTPDVGLLLWCRLVCCRSGRRWRETSKGSFATITSWLLYPFQSPQRPNTEWGLNWYHLCSIAEQGDLISRAWKWLTSTSYSYGYPTTDT